MLVSEAVYLQVAGCTASVGQNFAPQEVCRREPGSAEVVCMLELAGHTLELRSWEALCSESSRTS